MCTEREFKKLRLDSRQAQISVLVSLLAIKSHAVDVLTCFPVSCKRYRLECAPIEDSDQPAQAFSLVRVFNRRSKSSQGGKPRLWSDCIDAQTDFNLLCTRMPTCTGLIIQCNVFVAHCFA